TISSAPRLFARIHCFVSTYVLPTEFQCFLARVTSLRAAFQPWIYRLPRVPLPRATIVLSIAPHERTATHALSAGRQPRARLRLPANDRMPPLATEQRGIGMHARAQGALVSMVVAVGLSLAGCALIDELKDTVSNTVSKMASQDGHGREGDVPDILPTITPREEAKLPTKTPTGEAKRASTEKDRPARKLQVKRPSSVPAEPVTQDPAGQSPPSQSASSQLLTPWPNAPSSGSFSR